MRSFFSVVTPLALCITLLWAAAGCESDPKSLDPISVEAIRANMTPELMSTAKSEGQALNHNARVLDNNNRGIWDDLSRLMFLDRSSGLTPYPSP